MSSTNKAPGTTPNTFQMWFCRFEMARTTHRRIGKGRLTDLWLDQVSPEAAAALNDSHDDLVRAAMEAGDGDYLSFARRPIQ